MRSRWSRTCRVYRRTALRGLSGLYTLPFRSWAQPHFGMATIKITLKNEFWSEEVQQFSGLPDCASMLEEMMQEYRDWREKLVSEALMKNWNSEIGGGRLKMQKMFWSHCPGIPPKA